MKKAKQYQDPILYFLPPGVKPVTQIVVCPTCGGQGSNSPKQYDDSRLIDSMAEDGDQESIEHYFNGGFDLICQTCNGQNVVRAVDREWIEQNHPQALHDLHDSLRSEAQDRAYAAQERRACGGF